MYADHDVYNPWRRNLCPNVGAKYEGLATIRLGINSLSKEAGRRETCLAANLAHCEADLLFP
jgi:hypothetical protein